MKNPTKPNIPAADALMGIFGFRREGKAKKVDSGIWAASYIKPKCKNPKRKGKSK